MRKRVVSLGLALVMALGVSGVSGLREVRAEQVVKVIKSKEFKDTTKKGVRGTIPSYAKKAGIKGVKDADKYIWKNKVGGRWVQEFADGKIYRGVSKFTDGTYGIKMSEESFPSYCSSVGKALTEEDYEKGVYCGVYELRGDQLVEAMKSKSTSNIPNGGVYLNKGKDYYTVEREKKKEEEVAIYVEEKDGWKWVVTLRDVGQLKDKTEEMKREEKIQNMYLEDGLKPKFTTKKTKEGTVVNVKIEGGVSEEYLKANGYQAPLKITIKNFTIWTAKNIGDGGRGVIGETDRGERGVLVKAGTKPGKYDYRISYEIKDKKGKIYRTEFDSVMDKKLPKLQLKTVMSKKEVEKATKFQGKVEVKKGKKVIVHLNRKVVQVYINGKAVTSYPTKAKKDIDITSMVKKDGVYELVGRLDGSESLEVTKITVKGLKK